MTFDEPQDVDGDGDDKEDNDGEDENAPVELEELEQEVCGSNICFYCLGFIFGVQFDRRCLTARLRRARKKLKLKLTSQGAKRLVRLIATICIITGLWFYLLLHNHVMLRPL